VKIQRTLQINSFVPKDDMRRHSNTMRMPVAPVEQPLEVKRRELVVGRAPTCDPNEDPLVQFGERCEIGLFESLTDASVAKGSIAPPLWLASDPAKPTIVGWTVRLSLISSESPNTLAFCEHVCSESGARLCESVGQN
jgi:hypothetical protein